MLNYLDYREYLRGLDCAMRDMDCDGPIEVHHLKGDFHQSGAGLKAPDYLAMPLCRMHHREIHNAVGNWRERQREALIRTLISAFDDGMIAVIDWSLPDRFFSTKWK